MAWCALAEVEPLTGTTVSASTLATADSVITTYAGITPSASGSVSARDAYWLKSATAWQAAFMSTKPGFAGREAAKGISQDGLSVQRDGDWQANLAPMASRALRNLSWKGTRSAGPGDGRQPTSFVLESSDERHGWSAL